MARAVSAAGSAVDQPPLWRHTRRHGLCVTVGSVLWHLCALYARTCHIVHTQQLGFLLKDACGPVVHCHPPPLPQPSPLCRYAQSPSAAAATAYVEQLRQLTCYSCWAYAVAGATHGPWAHAKGT